MPPASRLLVLAVTRLSDGVCAACLNEQCKWVRPTRENASGWRQLTVDDLKDSAGRIVVKVGNVVRWTLGPPAPRDVHSEDVFVGAARPQFEKTLPRPQLLQLCNRLCENDMEGFLSGSGRSLALFRPGRVIRVTFRRNDAEKLSARIRFRHGCDVVDLSVTDLAWRALGRSLLRQRGTDELSFRPAPLRCCAGLSILYLAVGRGQPFRKARHPLAGEYYPFIVSVLTDRAAGPPIDYADL